jgi:adenosylcobyric acid synthase
MSFRARELSLTRWRRDDVSANRMIMAKAIMLQGTGSDVGKTVLVAGLCRLARMKGLKVKPFKPQNMSNNAAVADDGGEIGRAQWLQALACGVAPSVHMNPVLLKPQSETGSQIIVQGKMAGSAKGRDYQALKPKLMAAVMESFRKLSDDADLIIVEGAGSPAEINLRAGDIANMGFATAADVPVVLVGDIDRGGVIASLVGTHAILPKADRRMIEGFVINKFRGDVSLFDDGLAAIKSFTGWDCFGVVPWLKEAALLPPEDSVILERKLRLPTDGRCVVAVLVLDRIANFDDLDPLKTEADVDLRFVRAGDAIPEDAVLVIIPGSKSTIADLARLKENGWDKAIHRHVLRGGRVLGICGGYQMLGKTVSDPQGLEGKVREVAGLGLLDVTTVMEQEKTVKNTRAATIDGDVPLDGYEIHLGVTRGPDADRPFAQVDGRADGAMSPDGRIVGTYLHGLFSSDAFRSRYLEKLGAISAGGNYQTGVDGALDTIALRLESLGLSEIIKRAR